MVNYTKVFKLCALMLLTMVGYNVSFAQTTMPLPAHNTTFSSNVRGYWFTAPTNFTITGLRVAPEAGAGTQNIQVIRINDAVPVVFSTTSTNFTSLAYIQGATNGVTQPVSISVAAGDIIGIFGQAGTTNSYGTAGFSTTINGQPVTLNRIGSQNPITGAGIPDYWTEAGGSISRIEMTYTTCFTPPATITTNPFNSTVCQGVSSAFFAVSATGTNLAYQWQVRAYNTGFSNVSNNSTYSGATNSVLVINNPTTAIDGMTYRCMVTADCAAPVFSADAMLTVNGQHALISHPQTTQICLGSNATFSVAATAQSTNTLSYQWQTAVFNSTVYTNIPAVAPYTGVNSSTLTITAPAYTLNGNSYRCVVSSLCGTPIISNAGQLDINLSPSISSQPANATVCEGGNTSFNVASQGNSAFYPYSYQWQVNTGSGFANIANGAPYSGANASTLVITSTPTTFNSYQYRCVVTGACSPSVTTDPATLTVNNKPTVSNPSNLTICEDAAASFSVTATGTSISYQWQVAPGGSSTYTNIGNVAPYGGANTATLSITSAPASFALNTYRCVVTGACAPAAISNAAELTIQRKPVITTNPSDFTTCNTSIQASYSVTATGTGLAYQWQTSSTGVAGTYTNLSNNANFSGVTTSTLSIVNGTLALNNNFFRCVVSGTCAPATISNAAQLFINMQAAITTQPANATVCETANTSFTTSATGTGLTYQWQVNTGAGFANVTNTGVYSGATAATLNITGATNSMNGYTYRCYVAGVCGPIAVTNVVGLAVNALTVIGTQPVASTVCAGTNATFSIGATAGGINYQWQVNTGAGFANIANGAPYLGNTSNTLTILGTPASFNNYQYRCVVGSICGPTLTSSAVVLTVNTLPAITTTPANATVCEGNPAVFVSSATGTAISYQWQVNSGAGFSNLSNAGIYSGVTTNILSISSTTAAMNGYTYRVVVSGTCTPAAMASAQLNVNTAPVINLQPVNNATCNGSLAILSINASGTGITYQWQVNNGAGFANIANVAPYAGATTATLGITTNASLNGYTYRCIVSGTCPSTLTSNTVTLTVLSLPAIATQPVNTAACINTPVTFTIGATGSGVSYQWQVNNGSGFNNLTTASTHQGHNTATLTVFNVQPSYAGYQYRCVVSGSCTPSVLSNIATLSINTLPTVTSNPVAATTCAGSNATFAISATGTGITYQWQLSAAGGAYTNISNGGVYSGATSNTLLITGATAGMHSNQYRCVVNGTCSPATTSTAAVLTVNTPPTVQTQPTAVSTCAATIARFNITASGNNLTYQWQLNTGTSWVNLTNGGIYSGTSTTNLTITNVTTAMRGYSYRCVVSNGCSPNGISNAAVLTVYGTPTILTAPSSVTICEGTAATFSTIVDALNPTYQWQVNTGTGWTNLTNGGNYSFVTTSAMMVSNVTLAMAGYQYRCMVTDACGVNYTGDAILNMYTKPVITKQPITQKGWYQDPFIFSVDAQGTNTTYQWQVDTTIAGQKEYINIADKPGAYVGTTTKNLQVIPTGGYMNLRYYRCVVSGTCTPSEISKDAQLIVGFKTGIETVANGIDVKVYPNPVSGNTLNVQLGNYNNNRVVVKITNTLGAVVATEALTLQNSIGSINVGTLAAGTYNLQVADADNNTLQVIRFVKQ